MWGFYNKFTHIASKILMSKMIKLVKITKKLLHFYIKQYIILSNLNIWSRKLKISYPDFSRIFRIRFFPGKKAWAVLGLEKLFAILTALLPISMTSVLLLPGRSWQIWKMQKTYFFGGNSHFFELFYFKDPH